jgi:hypothetical protein
VTGDDVMQEIVPGRLWLGNAADARNIEGVLQAGVLAVIDLAIEQLIPMLPRSIIYCRFPVIDGQQDSQVILRAAIETVAMLVTMEIPTLVCCGAGMSRSPAVVAAATAIVYGGDPDDRLREVVTGHPHDVSPQLWQSVRGLCVEMQQKRPS